MKKILLLLALLVATSAQAQSTRTQATANLMGLGMPGPLASEVAGLATGLGIQSGDLIFGANASIYQNTTDGADSRSITLSSGGSVNAGTRGGFVTLNGNEQGGAPGSATLGAGNASGASATIAATASNGSIVLSINSNTVWTAAASGTLTSNATNGGDLIFAGTGDTISVQEATAASACMGVATPNGTTPVAVTTSCATSGSRVFFTRVGAITNMGTISTTTAPSGSGFSFASTGASDTLASSVVYLIVKESA